MESQNVNQNEDFKESRYEDLLFNRRNGSDIRFSLREWEPSVVYKYGKALKQDELFKKIFDSEKVQKAINEVADGRPIEEVKCEVYDILMQMSHNLNLSSIRTFAFALSKIAKQIYGHIMINKEGINKLKQMTPESPILLMPTHRSYADFLVVSYVSYYFNLPLPVIAAGMDFVSMAIVGDMLRNAGAFFIRRSFSNDLLYKTIFREYVQLLMVEEVSPVEFFLEGTRSRSGKSLPPKLGMLGCAVESWLQGMVPDIIVVPMNISYDRTLEERLYAYEMLGIPKPKESTSGLLKAMRILKEDYGDIYVNIGEPISFRKYLEPKINRREIGLSLEYNEGNQDLLDGCKVLGYHILRQLQKESIISLWSMISLILMKNLWKKQSSIEYNTLRSEVDRLINLVKKLGGTVNDKPDLDKSLKRNLKVHSSLVSFDNNIISLLDVHSNVGVSRNLKLNEATIKNAILHLMLQHYCNQMIHIFIRPSLVTLSILSLSADSRGKGIPIQDVEKRFIFLRKLFSQEFVFEKDHEQSDFRDGLSVMTWTGEVALVQGSLHLVQPKGSHLQTFIDVIRPFILTYQTTASIAATQEWSKENDLIDAIQNSLEKKVQINNIYSSLSLDSVKLSIKILQTVGGLLKQGSDSVDLIPNQEVLLKISSILNDNEPDILSAKL